MHPQKVDFLFIYEVKARELENICLLACELERRGYSTAILNTWTMLKKRSRPIYSCTTLVVSACYNEEVYRFFTGFAAHYEKVFCLQWEQVPVNYSYHSRQVTSWTYQGVAKQVRNVCWGEAEQKRLVENFGVMQDCTRVTGYITLDFYRPMLRPMLISRQCLFGREGMDVGKKTCLFISSFTYVKLPPKLEAVADENGKEMTKLVSAQTQQIILGWIERLLCEEPELQFIYRPHPSEAENPALQAMARKFPRFFCIAQPAVKHWICACDRVYIWNSTTAAEAWQSGTPTFLLRPVALPEACDMPIFSDCETICCYEDFRASAVGGEKKAGSVRPQALHAWYADTGETPVYQNICEWLEETHADPTYKSPVVAPYTAVPYLRMWIEYKVIYPWKNRFVHTLRYRVCYWPIVWLHTARPPKPDGIPMVLYKVYSVFWRFGSWICRLAVLHTPVGSWLQHGKKGEQLYWAAVRQQEQITRQMEEENRRWQADKADIDQMQQHLLKELRREKQNRDTGQKREYDASKYRLNRAPQREIQRIKNCLRECLGFN